MRHDRLIILRLKESLESDLNSCLHRYMLSEFLLISAFQKYLILIIIFFDQRVNISFGNCLYFCCYFIDRIRVDLPAELDLRLNLIALCHRNIPHIVGNTHHTDMAALDHAHCSAHPGTDLLLDIRVLPVTHDHLALHAETAEDMTVLSVPVGRLILVHKIHINGVIRNLPVKLCMEVKQRLPVLLQAENPGFGRRERMHPGDDSRASLVRIRLVQSLPDQFIGNERRLPYNLIRKIAGCIQRLHDLLRMLRHVSQAHVPV